MNFASVIGHRQVKHRLLTAARDKRVSHTLLFLGPEGSGNLPMAMAFAQYLVCEDPGENDSCGTCSACLKMNKMVHPDVTYTYPVAPKEKISKPKSVDFVAQWRQAVLENPYLSYNDWMLTLDLDNKQGLISVEESSDIINRLNLKAVEAPYRIVIIWLPEKLHTSAANKLLKILEEPPQDALFFLVAENYEDIMQTILSRTQLVKVGRISDEEMFGVLTDKHGLDKITARRMVHRADGSYNEALSLLGNNEAENDLSNRFLSWMRSCLKLNAKEITEMAGTFSSESREQQKIFLKHALDIARECLLINYADRSLIRLEGSDLESMQRFAPFVNINNAEDFIQELNTASFHIERNGNSKMVFTDLSFKMYHLLQVKA